MSFALAAMLAIATSPARAEQGKTRALHGESPQAEACVRQTESGYLEPSTLDELMRCQFQARLLWTRSYEKANNASASDALLERLDEFQRGEVRGYMGRHPDAAQRATPSASEPQIGRTKTSAPKSDETASRCRSRGATDPEPKPDAEGLAELNRSLVAASDHGKKGVTKDGALDIVDFLECQQGFVSADMNDLLNRLVRDGPNLQNDSMLRLKKASREAKSNGLELGVDASMEKWLLDPQTDPADNATGPNPIHPTGSN